MLYKKYQTGTQKLVVPAGAEAQNGGVGMASMMDQFTGTPFGAIGDTAGMLGKELIGDNKAGSQKDVTGRQVQAGFSAAGAAGSVALNPAVMAATGGLSALAVPIAGIGGALLARGAAKRAETSQLQAENFNKGADITNSLVGNETTYVDPETTNTFGRTLYAKHGVRMGNNDSGLYQLTADFNGGPSHAEGGIKYIAPVKSGSATYLKPIEVEGGELEVTSGDGSKAIIPKNKAKKAKEFLKKGDDLAMKTLIHSLPSEAEATENAQGMSMYENGGMVGPPGEQWARNDIAVPTLQTSMSEPSFTLRGPENPFEGMGGSQEFSPLSDAPTLGNAQGMGNVGGQASALGSFLPTAYNLIQGGFGDAETYQPNNIELQKLQYRDMSDPRRQAIKGAGNLAAEQTRNYAFNASSQGQNARLANLQAQQQLMGVDLGELSRRDAIDKANVGLTNQERMFNLGQLEKAQMKTDQAAANKQDYLEAGIGGVGTLSDDMYTRRSGQRRDAKADAIQRQMLGTLKPTYGHMYGDKGLGTTYLDETLNIIR